MDLWVVAAATGAVYVAKYLKNLSGEKDSSSELSSVLSTHVQSETRNVLDQMQDTVFPLPRLARRWLIDGDVSSEKENVSNEYPPSSFPSIFSGKEVFQENVDWIDGKGEYLDNSDYFLHEYGTKKTDNYFTRRSCMKLNSLESSLTDNLHNEHAGMKEYAYSSLSTPTMRPLLLTGDLTIRTEGVKGYKISKESDVFFGEDNSSLGAASFEPIGSVKRPRRPERRCGKGDFGTRESDEQFHSQGNGMLSLFLGITIGILSTVQANKREVDKLNELLKHAEILVQDLHKELEMKDMITMKGLVNENNVLQGRDNFTSFSSEVVSSFYKQELDEYIKHDSEKTNDQKAENPENLMSEIEAELEAELERLEINLKGSILDRVSDFLEIDPDFEVDMVKGDLRPDLVNRELDSPSSSDHNDESENAGNPVPSANYTVSSLDLSIRLHEVIESRLRARMEELEIALHDSQSKLHSMESQPAHTFWDFAYSKAESSSTPESDMLDLQE